MGQPNARRIQYEMILPLTSMVNDDRQTLSNTGCLKVGDVLEFYDRNAAGCLGSSLGTRTITAICPNEAIILDSAIDLTVVTNEAVIRNRTVDDAKEMLDRICGNYAQGDDYKLNWAPAISACDLDTPIVGQSQQYVPDSSCFAAGDTYALISDEGLAGTGSVVSTDDSQNIVVIDASIDCGALTNPKLINTSVTMKEQFLRIKQDLDTIGQEICEELDDGDCKNTAFYASQPFLQNSSSVYLDGNRKRKGSAGTQASLVNDTGNAEITFTSLVLGLDGNDIDIEMIDPAAASQSLSITVTGDYLNADRKVSVSLATDGGSAIISTAQDVADAINADADAKRLMQAIYGGDGTGVQSALAATPLAGGLNDGTGDYAELQLISANALGEYGLISFHIRPDESNRMSEPPRDSEELDTCYRRYI